MRSLGTGLFSLHCPVSAGEQAREALQPQLQALGGFGLRLEGTPRNIAMISRPVAVMQTQGRFFQVWAREREAISPMPPHHSRLLSCLLYPVLQLFLELLVIKEWPRVDLQ